MARIIFESGNISIDVPLGTTLLNAARAAHACVGSTCGGSCACSSCHVYVQEGASLLSSVDDDEETLLTVAASTTANSRLACQAAVTQEGTVVVKISEESLRAHAEQVT